MEIAASPRWEPAEEAVPAEEEAGKLLPPRLPYFLYRLKNIPYLEFFQPPLQ